MELGVWTGPKSSRDVSHEFPQTVRELQHQMEPAGMHWGEASIGWGIQTGLSWGCAGV